MEFLKGHTGSDGTYNWSVCITNSHRLGEGEMGMVTEPSAEEGMNSFRSCYHFGSVPLQLCAFALQGEADVAMRAQHARVDMYGRRGTLPGTCIRPSLAGGGLAVIPWKTCKAIATSLS